MRKYLLRRKIGRGARQTPCFVKCDVDGDETDNDWVMPRDPDWTASVRQQGGAIPRRICRSAKTLRNVPRAEWAKDRRRRNIAICRRRVAGLDEPFSMFYKTAKMTAADDGGVGRQQAYDSKAGRAVLALGVGQIPFRYCGRPDSHAWTFQIVA